LSGLSGTLQTSCAALVRLHGEYQNNSTSEFLSDGKPQQRICSKLFTNRDFGFLKITVERPLRLNFQASAERIARLTQQSAFAAVFRAGS
jgi:type I restriction enzyme M protein